MTQIILILAFPLNSHWEYAHFLTLIYLCLLHNYSGLLLLGPGACSENHPFEKPRHSRQGFVVVNSVGHPKELLHCVHHFGRFCSQQFAIQDQNLEKREKRQDDLNLYLLQEQTGSRSSGQQPWLQTGDSSLHRLCLLSHSCMAGVPTSQASAVQLSALCRLPSPGEEAITPLLPACHNPTISLSASL